MPRAGSAAQAYCHARSRFASRGWKRPIPALLLHRTKLLNIKPDALRHRHAWRASSSGQEHHLHLELGSHRLVTLASREKRWQPGRRARIELRRPLYFDANGGRLEAAA
jgi:hypothetical protein